MQKPEIIAIAALGKRTRNICHDDELLWRIPEDLKHVKETTLGYPLIMGRKTYESIKRPLPNRTNIIITRNLNYPSSSDYIVVNSLEDALKAAEQAPGGKEKIFIFGGAEIYELAMPITEKLILTLVDSDKLGNRQFPEYESEFVVKNVTGGGIFEGDSYEWIELVRKSE